MTILTLTRLCPIVQRHLRENRWHIHNVIQKLDFDCDGFAPDFSSRARIVSMNTAIRAGQKIWGSLLVKFPTFETRCVHFLFLGSFIPNQHEESASCEKRADLGPNWSFATPS